MKKNTILPPTEKRAHNFKDFTGMRFGRLLVLCYAGREVVSTNPRIKYKSVFRCLCDCGKEAIIRSADLGRKTISCGCYARQRIIHDNIHNKSKESYCAFSDVYTSYRLGSKKRGYSFNISKDDFLKITKMNCFYCGQVPSGTRKSRTKGTIPDYVYNGIDRVNNDIGYEMNNIVPCCSLCNKMKYTQSLEDFKTMIVKIYKHLGLGDV